MLRCYLKLKCQSEDCYLVDGAAVIIDLTYCHDRETQ